jgi:hypothetical protein
VYSLTINVISKEDYITCESIRVKHRLRYPATDGMENYFNRKLTNSEHDD